MASDARYEGIEGIDVADVEDDHGNVTADAGKNAVEITKVKVDVTPTETVFVFAKRAGRVVTRDAPARALGAWTAADRARIESDLAAYDAAGGYVEG